MQIKVISEMRQLCNTPGLLASHSIHKAAMHVRGEDNSNGIRQSPDALITESTTTVKRWFRHWLDFYELPCESKQSKKARDSPTRDSVKDLKLKEFVDREPVLYLDELAQTKTECSFS